MVEFYAGLSPREAREWEEVITALSYWPIRVAETVRAGQDRYTLARKGQTITVADALIEAVVREHQAVLVTNNLKHYPMPGGQLLPLDGQEQ